MKKPKIVYYTTPYGYGHVVRANAIANAIGDRAEIHLVSGIDIIFKLSKNIKYHRIDDLPGMNRLDYHIYYYDMHGRSDDVCNGKYVENYRRHFQKFINLVCKINPDLVVVDVTPEFAIYSKLLGYKTVELLLTGKKEDLRCQVSYGSSDHIVVPYPKNFIDVSYWPKEVQSKMFWSGAFSRFDGYRKIEKAEAKAKLNFAPDKKLVVCTFGRGDLGGKVIRKIEEISKQPEFENCVFKIFGNIKNVEEYLNAADCAITGAGDNTVTESSYFKIPMILIPLVRGYGEQTSKAAALEEMGAARVIQENEINEKLEEELLKILNDEEYIEQTQKAQVQFVDGRGAQRLADKIMEWV